MPLYADVIVPLDMPALTYSAGDPVYRPGVAVSVGLGANKIYTGIVWRLHDTPPKKGTARPISGVVEALSPLSDKQMRFWEWLAEYYMMPLGLVMKAALTASFKASGASDEEFRSAGFRPTMVRTVSVTAAGQEELNELFEELKKRTPAQYRALTAIADALLPDKLFSGSVPLSRVEASPETIKKLAERGAILIGQEERREEDDFSQVAAEPLETVEQELFEMLRRREGDITLWHSGAMLPVLNVMAAECNAGRDVFVMMPEISDSSPLLGAISRMFGERMVVYRPETSDRNRGKIYRRIAAGAGGRVIVGSRQAVFLPLDKVSLVVVDREHDALYKQNDYSPRFNYRDCAVMAAAIYGARTVLCSRTPSVESWFNAERGRYGYVADLQPYTPAITISDTIRAAKRGERKTHFNNDLLAAMGETLAAGGQIILFQNRRGFTTMVECQSCGWTPRCPHCNVHLTLHQGERSYKCHYCGTSVASFSRCPECSSQIDFSKGFGTEKIEEVARSLFPDAAVARLDSDTATTAARFRTIVGDFVARRTDILVGTQLLVRDLYASPVDLVGILNADNMLNMPDFRAAERTFQTVGFFAARCSGRVIIQTAQPDNPTLRQLVASDFRAMAVGQLEERRQFVYPPYCRLIQISMTHDDNGRLWQAAGRFHKVASDVFGNHISQPIQPLVDRIKGRYIVEFLLKTPRHNSFAEAKKRLTDVASAFRREYRDVGVTLNIDPQ